MRTSVVLLIAAGIAVPVLAQEREPNDVIARADPVPRWTLAVQGDLSSSTDVDFFCLSGQEGEDPTFVITHDRSVNFDFMVYDETNCAAAATAPNSGDSLSCHLPGRVFLRIWSRSGSGPYRIEIRPATNGAVKAQEPAEKKRAEEEAAAKKADAERVAAEEAKKVAARSVAGRWYYAGWKDDPGGGNSLNNPEQDWIIDEIAGVWVVKGRGTYDSVRVNGRQIEFRQVQAANQVFIHTLTLSEDGQKLEGGFTYYFDGAVVQTRTGQYYHRRQQ